MRLCFKFFALVLAPSLLSAPGFARDNWFEIELVIFERHGESSREIWPHDAPSIDTAKAFDLEMARLMPTYPVCPQLDQAQIQQIIDDEQLRQDMIISSVAAPDQPITDNQIAETLEQRIVKCIMPPLALIDELLVEQVLATDQVLTTDDVLAKGLVVAKGLVPEQALEQPAVTDSEPVGHNEYSVLTEQDQIASISQPEEQLPPLDLPASFSYQNINYQVVEPAEILSKIPIQVSAEQLADELLTPHLLDPASLQLTELVKKLRWQRNLTPKLHIGWRQQVLARHLARPLHLFAGQDFSDRYQPDGSQIVPPADPELTAEQQEVPQQQELAPEQQQLLQQQQAQQFDSLVSSQEVEPASPETPAHLWEINGLFKVYLNRYLFIETQMNRKIASTVTLPVKKPLALQLDGTGSFWDNAEGSLLSSAEGSLLSSAEGSLLSNAEGSLLSNAEGSSISLLKTPGSAVNDINGQQSVETNVPWLVNHRLAQHRRVKSKQIHYFDHPDFGIIVQIRRFTLEPKPTASD